MFPVSLRLAQLTDDECRPLWYWQSQRGSVVHTSQLCDLKSIQLELHKDKNIIIYRMHPRVPVRVQLCHEAAPPMSERPSVPSSAQASASAPDRIAFERIVSFFSCSGGAGGEGGEGASVRPSDGRVRGGKDRALPCPAHATGARTAARRMVGRRRAV